MRTVRAERCIAAVVLAGGAGRRMGADKALLRLPDGRTTLAHVLEAAHAVADPVLLSVDTDAHAARLGLDRSARLLLDAQPGTGPLAALAAAMRAVDTLAIVALAVDTPLVTSALLRRLCEVFIGRDGGTEGAIGDPGSGDRAHLREDSPPVDAVACLVGDVLQPLPAIYSSALAARAERLLVQGRRSMRALLEDPGMRLRVLDEGQVRRVDPDLRSFAGANTPEEWQHLLLRAAQDAATQHEMPETRGQRGAGRRNDSAQARDQDAAGGEHERTDRAGDRHRG